MNNIFFYIEEFKDGVELLLHGIRFHDCVIVRALIDGELINEKNGFEDSLIYIDELARSAERSGRYLIFTCACGIAEDGGWEGVEVNHYQNEVTWNFELGDEQYKFIFSKRDYLSEVDSVVGAVKRSTLSVEPSHVIFPESM